MKAATRPPAFLSPGNAPAIEYCQMEVGVRRNEYVTRLGGYEQLEHLLDYLLPVAPEAA
jgi:hypothetical protein